MKKPPFAGVQPGVIRILSGWQEKITPRLSHKTDTGQGGYEIECTNAPNRRIMTNTEVLFACYCEDGNLIVGPRVVGDDDAMGAMLSQGLCDALLGLR